MNNKEMCGVGNTGFLDELRKSVGTDDEKKQFLIELKKHIEMKIPSIAQGYIDKIKENARSLIKGGHGQKTATGKVRLISTVKMCMSLSEFFCDGMEEKLNSYKLWDFCPEFHPGEYCLCIQEVKTEETVTVRGFWGIKKRQTCAEVHYCFGEYGSKLAQKIIELAQKEGIKIVGFEYIHNWEWGSSFFQSLDLNPDFHNVAKTNRIPIGWRRSDKRIEITWEIEF